MSMRMRQRVIGLVVFLGLLVLFRHLALIGVTFVIFAHVFGYLGQRAAKLLGSSERRGTGIVLVLMLTLISVGLYLLVHFSGRGIQNFLAKNLQEGQSIPELLRQMQEDLLHRLPPWLNVEGLKERLPHMVQPAVDYLRATGRTLLHLLIGIILAIIYVLDRSPVQALVSEIPEDSIMGSVKRYFGYLAEAILITISLQVLVAVVNTLLTLPLLLALRLPHIGAFTILIFVSSLVPVVGNLVSGAVLIVASYVYRGIGSVIAFVVTTFILHKIEAYYLNPRLATRHVNLPSLVLIISLILHEHVFGLVGLFLSFPVLYIGLNVTRDFRELDTLAAPPAKLLPDPDDCLPSVAAVPAGPILAAPPVSTSAATPAPASDSAAPADSAPRQSEST